MNIIQGALLLLCTILCAISPTKSQQNFEKQSESQDNFLLLQEDSADSPVPNKVPSVPLVIYAGYNEQCNPYYPIQKTLCKTFERTVACIGYGPIRQGKCGCNLGEDAEFHEQWEICVSKVGSLCFLNENALGRKVCVENADCFADQEGPGHNVGRCECLYGFMEDDSGHCIVDPNVPEEDRSTVRPTTPFPTRAPAFTGETSEQIDEDITPSPTPGTSGGSCCRQVLSWQWSSLVIVVSLSFLYL